MKFIYVVLLICASLFFNTACSNPQSRVIPKDQTKWETELKPYIQKLSEEEKGLITKYLLRTKLGESFGGQGIPKGTTIGDAIEKQREFDQDVARKEQEAKLLKEKLEAEKAAQTKKFNDALIVAFINKSFIDKDIMSGRYQAYNTVDFGFQNKTSKDIIGFKGDAVFSDMFGEKINSLDLSYDKTIPANSSIQWEAASNYNQFMDSDVKFRNTATDKMQFKFIPKIIVFADGSKLEMPDK